MTPRYKLQHDIVVSEVHTPTRLFTSQHKLNEGMQLVLATDHDTAMQDAGRLADAVIEAHRARLRHEGYQEEDVLSPLNYEALEQLAVQFLATHGRQEG